MDLEYAVFIRLGFGYGDLLGCLRLFILRQVAGYGKPIVLSTGGASMEDIDRAVETILPVNSQLCILQCTSAYPVDIAAGDAFVRAALSGREPTRRKRSSRDLSRKGATFVKIFAPPRTAPESVLRGSGTAPGRR